MRITTSYSEFVRTTGVISADRRLRALGLEFDSPIGMIWPREMEDVLDLCAQNPQYHIVSYMGEGILINRYDPRGRIFRLAEGDNDPNYMADRRHVYRWMFATDPESGKESLDIDLRKASE